MNEIKWDNRTRTKMEQDILMQVTLVSKLISSPVCQSPSTLYFQWQECDHNKHMGMQLV